MKLLTIQLAILCIAIQTAFCQTYQFAKFKDYNSLTEKEDKKAQFISQSALNLHFNKQMARYLSGSEDLVMNKTYAILDSEDDEITLGGTIASKNDKNLEFVQYMSQIGIKIKAADNFGEIWNKEDGFAASAGLFWKGTIFSKGRLTFGNSYVQTQEIKKEAEPVLSRPVQRIIDLQSYEKYQDVVYRNKYEKELEELTKDLEIYADTHGLNDSEKKEKLAAIAESLYKKLEAEYMEKVQENLATSDNYVATHKAWLSMEFFIPITPTEYLVADSVTSSNIKTIELAPYSAELIASYLYARRNGSRYFGSMALGLQAHNSITRDDNLKKHAFKTFAERDNSGSEVMLTETSSKDVYVGEVDQLILIPSIELNFTVMFGGRFDFTGLSASSEYRMDPDNDGWYLKFGVPFSLAGKDEETKVNFEPLVKWNSNDKNALVGLSVGLPFGKSIY